MNAPCRSRDWLLTVAMLCLLMGGCEKAISPDDELIAELVHKDIKHRRTAVICIREMRPVPEVYIEPLKKSLNDEDPRIRKTAAEALGEVGAAGRPYFRELVKIANEHTDAEVRETLQASVQRINQAQ